ncbi:hypothetical protein FOMPIDRAFT_84997 [Fomitopsis schrenkii]|uniref:Uncharacterized protein n=1 Tax=Fomitopsis schrenkii TaxID=2126942 RepID=S8F6K9_FOMSC|nr:hypothetical protein FOMPIDRAFT_84997 [Fomitopsis schrenkii]
MQFLNVAGPANHVAAINQLPFELLALVFATIPETDTHPRPLNDVMLVCQHWRAVALEHPHWWSEMTIQPTTPPYGVAKWLERSKDAPLRLTLLDPRDEDFIIAEEEPTATLPGHLYANVRALRDHAHRIEHFELSGHSLKTTADILSALSGAAAPRLQSLQVEPVKDRWTLAPQTLLDTFYTIRVFQGHTQGIRKLAIAYVRFPLAPYSNLRELRLAHQRNLASGDLLSLLTRSPALEVLDLEDSHVDWPKHVVYPADTVALPRLRDLLLGGPQLQVLHTLGHLDFPATTLVEVRLEGRAQIDGREAVYEHVDNDLPQNQGGGDSGRDPIPHCHSLRAVASNIEDITLDYTDEQPEFQDDIILTLSSPDVSLVVTWRWSMFSDPSEGGMWHDLVPLPAVQRLRINCIPVSLPISQVEWRTFFGLMPSLHTIEVTHDVIFYPERCYIVPEVEEPADLFEQMFLALSRPTPDPVTRAWKLPCPNLHSVVISHRTWGPFGEKWHGLISACNTGRRGRTRRPIELSFEPCMCVDCEKWAEAEAAMAAAAAAGL